MNTNPPNDGSSRPVWRVEAVPFSGLWHVIDAQDTEAAIPLPDGEFAWQTDNRDAADRAAAAQNAGDALAVDTFTGPVESVGAPSATEADR